MFLVMVGSFAAMVFFSGALSAVVPWLMRRRECFAVTIPETAQRDPRIMAMKRRYAAVMMALTVVCTVLVAGVLLVLGEQGANKHPVLLTGAIVVGVTVPIAASFALMLHYRKQITALKHAQGWKAESAHAAAVIADIELPSAIPLWWNLLYLPVIALTAGVAIVGYPYMPDMIPMHSDFAGNVTDWAEKSPGVAAFPVLVQLFMAVVFVFSHWSITRSKAPISPDRPTASAYAYGVFARSQSIFLLASGLLISTVLGLVFDLSALDVIGMDVCIVIILAAVAPVLIGAVAISVVYGQAGSRVFARLEDKDGLPADDDEHWKLGIFYFNRDDASLFLPERFGIGWTINLGRPAAWAVIAGFILFTVLFLCAVFALVS